jgi:hypothetical protein
MERWHIATIQSLAASGMAVNAMGKLLKFSWPEGGAGKGPVSKDVKEQDRKAELFFAKLASPDGEFHRKLEHVFSLNSPEEFEKAFGKLIDECDKPTAVARA